jgi:hypothetical protein
MTLRIRHHTLKLRALCWVLRRLRALLYSKRLGVVLTTFASVRL